MVEKDEIAIKLENLSRGYGDEKVIEKLNLVIKKGTINSLIGSSGSGKTTILRTILGKLTPDEGIVEIFGKQPYEDSNFPGSSLGYAPQEVSLYREITIEENLSFFASIHGMSKEFFQQRRDYLKELLELPKLSKIVSTLSGGQQRRVSLAIALLHSPKLLILDEPTVGVCPLVTANIWRLLSELSKRDGVTILITTHYLSECRSVDSVFLLRNGKILEKGAPDYLLVKYDSILLEDVYYKLCRSDEELSLNLIETKNAIELEEINNQRKNSISDGTVNGQLATSNILHEVLINSNVQQPISIEVNQNEPKNTIFKSLLKFFNQAFAVSKRKIFQIYRSKLFLCFEILSPVILIALFFLAIGNVPENLNYAVHNVDSGDFGGQLIHHLEGDTMFKMTNYSNSEQAILDIESGDLWGLIYIPENFTNGMINRILDPLGTPILNSEVDIYMDLANFQINLLVKIQLQEAFEKLGNDSGIVIAPYNKFAIYGDEKAKFNWFLAPAMVGIITYAHCMSFLSIIFVREGLDGTRDRLFSYGVKPGSIILGQVVGHLPILFIQFSLLLIISVYGFDVPIKGNIVLIYMFLFFLNLIAIGQGILIATVVFSEVEAIQISLAFFFCSLFLSGIIWFTEGIIIFGFISNLIPSTWSSIALRSLMIKDLPFSHQFVWRPFVILVAWIVFIYTISTFTLPVRERNFSITKLFSKFKLKNNK